MLARKRVVFVVGGPYGFSSEVYNRSDLKLSLSRMTFLTSAGTIDVFTEQLYRVFSVIKGDPYHTNKLYKAFIMRNNE